jgi:hypothetical protein
MLRRRRPSFWLVLLGTTAFLVLDPALFLVVVALALSGVALLWIVMLAHALIVGALDQHEPDESARRACPVGAWRGGSAGLSPSPQRTPSDRGVIS